MGGGDISTDINILNNACTMNPTVDELLTEAGEGLELYKQQQVVPTTSCTPVHGRTRFYFQKRKYRIAENFCMVVLIFAYFACVF